jgi:hypothetical protein
MDRLRNLTDVFRNHYEKIILTLVLIGLAVAVLFVQRASQRTEEAVDASVKEILSGKPKPVPPADLTNAVAVIKLHKSPPTLNFSAPHNLLNPVQWKRRGDQTLIKAPSQVEVWDKMYITRITPLKLTLSLDKIPNPGGYFLGYQNEAAENPTQRKKYSPYVKLNETNKMTPRPMVLREIRGPQEKPDELIVEFIDLGEKVTVTPDKPFERIEAYEGDLRNDFTGEAFSKLRVGAPFRFLNDYYTIAAITEKEVVVQAGNDKRYTVRQFASPLPTTNAAPRAASLLRRFRRLLCHHGPYNHRQQSSLHLAEPSLRPGRRNHRPNKS